MVAFAAMFIGVTQANAQMGKPFYINGGWQFNGTIANDFAESAQGYGAYIEEGALPPYMANVSWKKSKIRKLQS